MNSEKPNAIKDNYWLRLLEDSDLFTDIDFSLALRDGEELIRIFTLIVKTAQNNQ